MLQIIKMKNKNTSLIFFYHLSFNFKNNEIIIENQYYKIFFSKFLDISKKITADDE